LGSRNHPKNFSNSNLEKEEDDVILAQGNFLIIFTAIWLQFLMVGKTFFAHSATKVRIIIHVVRKDQS
jgi:hypothetical protein